MDELLRAFRDPGSGGASGGCHGPPLAGEENSQPGLHSFFARYPTACGVFFVIDLGAYEG